MKASRVRTGYRVLVDTVTLVYFLEHHHRHFRAAKRLFQRIETGEISGVASALMLAEVLVPLYRTNEPGAAAELSQTLRAFPNLSILDASAQVCTEAARLRAQYGLRTPDAVHGATALVANAHGIVTNDAGFERLTAEGLAIFRFE